MARFTAVLKYKVFLIRQLLRCPLAEALMNRVFGQRNLDWVEARISEAESRIVAEKLQLAELENQGINTGEACRRLAITTEYLRLLIVRRDAAIEKLRQMANLEH